ncbi:hypothetical protein HMPREF6123_0876 [Oribacterium sinus F0268]|uniref:Uncharacterized protein n=1 Tax=Oribacterium sinus F0268 TaxID=585501 RepID=C2KWK7_9FIRM|nr:hypothetical protein HMPREF6123_0876 [Oribacterium sinus F0268]
MFFSFFSLPFTPKKDVLEEASLCDSSGKKSLSLYICNSIGNYKD